MLTCLLTSKLLQVELLERELHKDRALLYGIAGSREPIQVWAGHRSRGVTAEGTKQQHRAGIRLNSLG